MTYDEHLAERIRQLLAAEPDVTEKKMFGGLAFLVAGNMAVAASGSGGALVRSDPRTDLPPGAELAVMRGRPIEGWLRVADEHLEGETALRGWVDMGVARARSLPPKG